MSDTPAEAPLPSGQPLLAYRTRTRHEFGIVVFVTIYLTVVASIVLWVRSNSGSVSVTTVLIAVLPAGWFIYYSVTRAAYRIELWPSEIRWWTRFRAGVTPLSGLEEVKVRNEILVVRASTGGFQFQGKGTEVEHLARRLRELAPSLAVQGLRDATRP